jgi:hypothetical protein
LVFVNFHALSEGRNADKVSIRQRRHAPRQKGRRP